MPFGRFKVNAFGEKKKTGKGLAMLSGVLNHDRAIKVNIPIMRTVTQFRKTLFTYDELKAGKN